jgi:hypothetical protein
MLVCRLVAIVFLLFAAAFPFWVVSKGWQDFFTHAAQALIWLSLSYLALYFFVYAFPSSRLGGWMVGRKQAIQRRLGL